MIIITILIITILLLMIVIRCTGRVVVACGIWSILVIMSALAGGVQDEMPVEGW